MDMNKVNSAFEAACIAVKTLTKRPSDEELLELYGYYKQATEHDNVNDEPGFFEFTAHKKWKAWKNLEGQDSNTMKLMYIRKVQHLMQKYNK